MVNTHNTSQIFLRLSIVSSKLLLNLLAELMERSELKFGNVSILKGFYRKFGLFAGTENA